jgi:hypothetical protein
VSANSGPGNRRDAVRPAPDLCCAGPRPYGSPTDADPFALGVADGPPASSDEQRATDRVLYRDDSAPFIVVEGSKQD